MLKNGKEVIESINHFLDTQTYPREKYDIAVAATQLSEEDLVTLLQMPVNIVVPDKEHCTKIYAIHLHSDVPARQGAVGIMGRRR